MVGEWTITTIGAQLLLQRGFDITRAGQRSGHVPVVSSGGVSSYHDTPAAEGPGVVLGRKGVVGSVYFVKEDYWPHDTTLWVKDFKGNHARFIYYFFRERARELASLDVGSANPTLNRNHIHPTSVLWPPISEQRTIAHILGALDDKIELNRRMNETLEAMAQALFKSWFVDFDPVRAKAEGSRPKGIDAETARLFPNQLVGTDSGEIPKGWTSSTLREVTSKIGSGATPHGGDRAYVNDGIAFIRSQNVYDSAFTWEGLVRISDADAEQLRGVTVQRDDVLLNITGASILRTCVVDEAVLPARVSQHVAIVRARGAIPGRYLHLHLLRPSTKAYLLARDAGASRQAVTKGHIESVPIVLPTEAVLGRFSQLLSPLYDTIGNNRAQSRVLASLRDALLPRLLSGELSVRHAERLAEAAL